MLRTSDGAVGILSPQSALSSAKHGEEAATRGGASADGGTRQTPRMRVRGATGGIPTKQRAPQSRMDGAPYAGCARGSRRCAEAKRREDSAKPNPKGAQASACAAGTPPKLRADRMCRAGNAAAASRARITRRVAWRWTRPRTQSSDCGAGSGRSQAALRDGGRGCVTAAQAGLANRASQAERKRVPSGIFRVRTCKHTPLTCIPHHTRASSPNTWHPQNTLPKITSPQ